MLIRVKSFFEDDPVRCGVLVFVSAAVLWIMTVAISFSKPDTGEHDNEKYGAACDRVTEENWPHPNPREVPDSLYLQFGEYAKMSVRNRCMYGMRQADFDDGAQLRPCTLGGVAKICATYPDNESVIMRIHDDVGSDRHIVWIRTARDLVLIWPYLKLI